MIKRILLAAIALLVVFASPLHAQLTTVTASSIKMAGVPVASGTVTFIPTNYAAQAIAITAGGTLYDAQGFTANITGGAIVGTFRVPNACTASPTVANTQMFYLVRVFNSITQQSFTLTRVDGVCGTTWPLDSYVPTQSAPITATGVMSGTSVPARCVGASIFYTLTSPVNVYNCVSGVYVLQGPTGAFSYTTLTPAPLTNTNVVGAGDSRMAGSSVPAGQGFLDYLATQPQFASRATFYNGAVGGATCASMTSAYAANVQPHKPAGAITTSYAMIEEGINDIMAGTSAATIETCYAAYVAQAVTDGITPVIFTVYYSSAETDTQETQRILFNNWLRTNFPSYLVIDSDWLFPSTSSATNPFYVDQTHLNGNGNRLWAQATNYLWGLGKSGTNLFTDLDHDYLHPASGGYRIYGGLTAGLNAGPVTNGYIVSAASATTGSLLFGSNQADYIFDNGTGTTWNINSGGLKLTSNTGFAISGGSITACATGVACNPDNSGYLISANSATSGAFKMGADGQWYFFRSGLNSTSLTLNGGIQVTLGDTAGAYKWEWDNSSGTPVASVNSLGVFSAKGVTSTGTQTVSGCSLSGAVGGATAGKFTSGTTGTCTVTITPGFAAANGFACFANDLTTTADHLYQTASSTTTATIAGTAASSDVVTWGCIAY